MRFKFSLNIGVLLMVGAMILMPGPSARAGAVVVSGNGAVGWRWTFVSGCLFQRG